MRKVFIVGVLLISVAIIAGVLWASQSKDVISYQGRLLDDTGMPFAGDTVSMTFSIYDGETAGAGLWSESQVVEVEDGIYNVRLGEVTPIPDDLFNGAERWLGIQVGADPEMTPRKKITSVAFAINAKRVGGKKIQIGTATLNVSASITGTASVTFPEIFSTIPKVTTSGLSGQIGGETFVVRSITNITTTGFDATYQCLSGSSATGNASFDWIAVEE